MLQKILDCANLPSRQRRRVVGNAVSLRIEIDRTQQNSINFSSIIWHYKREKINIISNRQIRCCSSKAILSSLVQSLNFTGWRSLCARCQRCDSVQSRCSSDPSGSPTECWRKVDARCTLIIDGRIDCTAVPKDKSKDTLWKISNRTYSIGIRPLRRLSFNLPLPSTIAFPSSISPNFGFWKKKKRSNLTNELSNEAPPLKSIEADCDPIDSIELFDSTF